MAPLFPEDETGLRPSFTSHHFIYFIAVYQTFRSDPSSGGSCPDPFLFGQRHRQISAINSAEYNVFVIDGNNGRKREVMAQLVLNQNDPLR